MALEDGLRVEATPSEHRFLTSSWGICGIWASAVSSRLAGHSKVETTLQTYADLWPTDHRDLAQLLDRFGWGTSEN